MTAILAMAGIVIKEMYRRKDFYVLLILTVLVTLLLGSVSIFGDTKIVRYMKDLCLLLIWACMLVIAVTTAARQLPTERENRTIFPLLAKPVTRGQVLLGKFLGCWFACGISLLVFYAFFGVVAASREHAWPLINYAEAIWLHGMALAIVIAMTLLGSVVFSAPSSNVTIIVVIATGILLVGRHLNKVAAGLPDPQGAALYAVYFLIPHLEMFDMRNLIIHNWPPVPAGIIALVTLYGAAWTALFLTVAWLIFRKRPLS